MTRTMKSAAVATLVALATLLGCFATSNASAAVPDSRQDIASAAAATRPPGPWQGCPLEAFCIYPQNKGWNGGHPQSILRAKNSPFEQHGHWQDKNLVNMYGNHKVFMNGVNTDYFCHHWGGMVWLKRGYNGTGGTYYGPVMGGQSYDVNFTPVNSIRFYDGGFELAC